MFEDKTYQLSFILAIILHLVILLFLVAKFAPTKLHLSSKNSNNIIKAFTVANTPIKPEITQAPAKPPLLVKQPPKNDTPTRSAPIPDLNKSNLQKLLNKKMLKEQADELAELKKERKKQQKKLDKQNEQELQKQLKEQLASEQQELSNNQNNLQEEAMSGELNTQKSAIMQAISSRWIKPDNLLPSDFTNILIKLAPGGVVLDAKIISSTNNEAMDRSALAAILKSSPLPVTEDQKIFDQLRELSIVFRPEGLGNN